MTGGHAAHDPVVGEIGWTLADGRLHLAGDAVPTVELVRSPGPVAAHIPIGTRDRDRLTLTIDGQPIDLRPGPGRLSRGSYRVAVTTAAGPLVLTPSTPTAARLVRGPRYRGDNELGTVTRAADGAVTVEWSGPVSALGVTVPAPEPRPDEAALGYALAAAFGTGAQLVLPALISAVGRMLPG